MPEAAETHRPAADTTSPGTIRSASVTDRATKDDLLGFKPYVAAIATFLQAPETEAPITLSIEGEWGSGKSSLLLMLEEQLKTKPNPAIVIPFNAWRYDKQDELWAAFALHVTRGLRNGVTWPKRYSGDVKLFFSRIKGAVGWVNFLGFALLWLIVLLGAAGLFLWSLHESYAQRAAAVHWYEDHIKAKPQPPPTVLKPAPATTALPPAAVAQAPAAQKAQHDDAFFQWLLLQGKWAGSLAVVLAALGGIGKSVRTRLLDFRLERFIDRPDYKGHASFIEAFHEDFSKTLDAYLGDSTEKVYVMVDDLDRCDVPRAAELMQAINLMIGETRHLIFILGMDRDKVAAGIAYKYKEVLPYLPGTVIDADKPSVEERLAFGHAFLEKFIQLSFRVPVPGDDLQLKSFLEKLGPAEPQKTDSIWKSVWTWLAYGQQTSFIRHPNYNPLSDRPDPASPIEEMRSIEPQSFTEYCRIHTGEESSNVHDVVLMVKNVFNSNPRRLKLFLNAFRLSVYLASRQGLFDRVSQSPDEQAPNSSITIDQLGKFVALAMRCPRLLNILNSDHYLIKTISTDPYSACQALSWLGKPGVLELLRYGLAEKMEPFDPVRYDLTNFPVRKLLCLIPLAPAPSIQESASLEEMITNFKSGQYVSTADKNAALASIAEKAARERKVDELVERRTSKDPFDILIALAVAGRYVVSASKERILGWSSMAAGGIQYRGTTEEDSIQYHALRLTRDLLNAGRLTVKMRKTVRAILEENIDFYMTSGSSGKNRLKLANTILERLSVLDAADQPSLIEAAISSSARVVDEDAPSGSRIPPAQEVRDDVAPIREEVLELSPKRIKPRLLTRAKK